MPQVPCHFMCKWRALQGSTALGAALWLAIATAISIKTGIPFWAPGGAADGAAAAVSAVAAADSGGALGGLGDMALDQSLLGGLVSRPNSGGEWAQLLLFTALSPAGMRLFDRGNHLGRSTASVF